MIKLFNGHYKKKDEILEAVIAILEPFEQVVYHGGGEETRTYNARIWLTPWKGLLADRGTAPSMDMIYPWTIRTISDLLSLQDIKLLDQQKQEVQLDISHFADLY